jgi:GMP synthase (glutamine-hydrolysing)
MQHDAVAVIDFGGQYAHLIATKVRRHGVLAEIRQPEDPIEAFRPYKGIIISGSPSLASHGEDSDYNKGIYDLDLPILGFCFGHQEIAQHYGGKVEHGGRQWGRTELHLTGEHPLFAGLDPVQPVWMSHYDSVVEIGPQFEELGWSSTTTDGPGHRYAAIGSDTLRRYGLQFHPEVDDTVHGDEMIANFVFGICGCEPSWTIEAFMAEEMDRIRTQVGERSVFLLASGGVDSTVAATLLTRALGPERVDLLHVDNGLMRKDESAHVLEFFAGLGLGSHVHFVDASDRFLAALDGLIDPEEKRRAIGNAFIGVFQDRASELGIEGHLLGQGTIYPDTIETGGTKRADTIKTHHNRVEIIEEMIEQGRVIEVWRHPFPGPGLGVRCLCGDGAGDRTGFETITPAVEEVGRQFGLEALPLPIRSVGVKADLRAYEHPVLLSGDVSWARLMEAASVLTADVPGINRCVWNLGTDVPRSARPLRATMTRERLDVLREADHMVMESLRRHALYDEIWQCPTVLIPLSLSGTAGELVVVRPVHSERAMTAAPVRLPLALIDELRRDILGIDGVSSLALDVTSKPPGTIEWE